jgi:rubrerythrin
VGPQRDAPQPAQAGRDRRGRRLRRQRAAVPPQRVRLGDRLSEGRVLHVGVEVDPPWQQAKANDVKIGNYALTLEYLEAAFYAAAVKANFPDSDIAGAAKTLAAHEAAHVAVLKKVLGKAAVKPPTVNTDTVGKLLADEKTFIKTAAMIEPVGTAAYAGAGPYINNLAIVKAALSIHSVEANHAAYTAALVKLKGIDKSVDPIPNAFNPAYSFAKTVKTVTGLNIVKGDLQP